VLQVWISLNGCEILLADVVDTVVSAGLQLL
jgi:hypothetical protein